ncbi:iron-siderophore ABC transporter substrate-binding protein [Nocardiopsis tropica]|jgi:iron complex transport system substrate-binding protein|uniref:Iron-siderophore ABC transporter substrate-binding protein n=1 Tax=Nocardiopsis tropica TaxID=109330 RepID=A0ABU7KY25_9ACTN|nr:iron-siderophore ABC transporter substrate-binding protein [Nocardiopsis umidischolae]MEE2054210.1 iron-siderophore ABC transporter substrate-binding protein [Nocardiopsis umidischolae]
MRSHRFTALTAAAVTVLTLAACGAQPEEEEAAAEGGSGEYPIVIEHALGTTTIEEQPERVASVNWANHEVPLALGVVPVGMAEANFGDDDDDGVLPWVDEKLDELGAETPVLFDENDGIDFEAVADTQPDVILASYSGLTQEDYDTLSDIAPVVAYPEGPWATSWRDIIRLNSQAIGLAEEGDQLIADLEQEIADVVAQYPQLEGKSAMFMTHVDPTDVSQVGFYTTHDTRTLFFEDLGLETPGSIAELSAGTDQFSLSQSTEQIDAFDDVDIITGYGDDTGELLELLQSDPLLSKMPAVERDSVYLLPGSSPLATAANPTPLSISWVLEDYVAALAEAADKVQ